MNNLKSKILITGLVSVFAFSASTLSFACGEAPKKNDWTKSQHQAWHSHHDEDGNHGKMHRAEKMLDKMKNELNLTPEQVAAIKDIHAKKREMKQDMRKSMNEHDVKHFMQLDPTSSSYQSDLEALAEKKAEKARQKVMIRGTVQAEVYEVLTPEQQTQFKAFKAKQKEHKKKHQHHS